MTSPESRRHDLYNGLTGILGERADALIAHLPSTESTQLATKAHIRALESSIDTVEANLTSRIKPMATPIDALGTRIDRIVLAVVAALVAIIAMTFV